jgi:hypothetical protein
MIIGLFEESGVVLHNSVSLACRKNSANYCPWSTGRLRANDLSMSADPLTFEDLV